MPAALGFLSWRLAPRQPEPAAVIQGIGRTLLRPLQAASRAVVDEIGYSEPNPPTSIWVSMPRTTTALLVADLGETRMRQLQAQGEAMNLEDAVAFTLAAIDTAIRELDGAEPGDAPPNTAASFGRSRRD